MTIQERNVAMRNKIAQAIGSLNPTSNMPKGTTGSFSFNVEDAAFEEDNPRGNFITSSEPKLSYDTTINGMAAMLLWVGKQKPKADDWKKFTDSGSARDDAKLTTLKAFIQSQDKNNDIFTQKFSVAHILPARNWQAPVSATGKDALLFPITHYTGYEEYRSNLDNLPVYTNNNDPERLAQVRKFRNALLKTALLPDTDEKLAIKSPVLLAE